MTVRPIPQSGRGMPARTVGRATRPLWIRVSRAVGRLLLAWRYRLTQQHRHRRLIVEHVSGRPVVVLPDVFNPVLFKSGSFLAESLTSNLISPGSRVLDMGTGTGVGAIAAAQFADRVVAVDINPEAVRCARINVLLNNLEGQINVRQGDLFDALATGDEAADSERFEVVLFNPPYFHGNPVDHYDYAWRSIDVTERFAAGLECHLLEGGAAYVVLSSDGESQAFLDAFRQYNHNIEILAERRFINETLTIYGIHPEER